MQKDVSVVPVASVQQEHAKLVVSVELGVQLAALRRSPKHHASVVEQACQEH